MEARTSKFNKNIKVIKSLGFGTYIQVNGLTQSGGVVESIWREILKKIKTEKIKTILIMGLGGGTLAKLLRKKYPNAKITGVEIDPMMIELGKNYLGLGQYNVEIIIQDGYRFKKGKYDLIIVDTYCGDNYPKKFESEFFLNNIKKLLSSSGIVIFNRLFFKEKKIDAFRFENSLKRKFDCVNTIYPQANMMIVCKL